MPPARCAPRWPPGRPPGARRRTAGCRGRPRCSARPRCAVERFVAGHGVFHFQADEFVSAVDHRRAGLRRRRRGDTRRRAKAGGCPAATRGLAANRACGTPCFHARRTFGTAILRPRSGTPGIGFGGQVPAGRPAPCGTSQRATAPGRANSRAAARAEDQRAERDQRDPPRVGRQGIRQVAYRAHDE